MSYRFYTQQLEATGQCPGRINTNRRKRVPWTDEDKQKAVDAYEAAEPTPETSAEIVKQIAEDMDQSPNGVRSILTKAGVYVRVTPNSKPAAGGGSSTGGTRVSKAASQEALIAAITDAGADVDEEIISKLTGKAAVYFTEVLNKVNS